MELARPPLPGEDCRVQVARDNLLLGNSAAFLAARAKYDGSVEARHQDEALRQQMGAHREAQNEVAALHAVERRALMREEAQSAFSAQTAVAAQRARTLAVETERLRAEAERLRAVVGSRRPQAVLSPELSPVQEPAPLQVQQTQHRVVQPEPVQTGRQQPEIPIHQQAVSAVAAPLPALASATNSGAEAKGHQADCSTAREHVDGFKVGRNAVQQVTAEVEQRRPTTEQATLPASAEAECRLTEKQSAQLRGEGERGEAGARLVELARLYLQVSGEAKAVAILPASSAVAPGEQKSVFRQNHIPGLPSAMFLDRYKPEQAMQRSTAHAAALPFRWQHAKDAMPPTPPTTVGAMRKVDANVYNEERASYLQTPSRRALRQSQRILAGATSYTAPLPEVHKTTLAATLGSLGVLETQRCQSIEGARDSAAALDLHKLAVHLRDMAQNSRQSAAVVHAAGNEVAVWDPRMLLSL